MSDQEQDLQQQQLAVENEQDPIPVEGSLNDRLSLLHLNQRSMESTIVADLSAAAPSPTRTAYGNHTPLKRRSSALAPPHPTDSDIGHRQLVAEGYLVLPLPSPASTERTAPSPQPNGGPLLHRCSSLSSNNGNLLNPPVESHARRPLFTSPAIGHTLPPPRPLNRTFSDPVPFSNLENPILSTGARSDLYAPRGNISALNSTQEPPSSKRPKRILIRTLSEQMKQLLDAIANQDDLDEHVHDSAPESETIPLDDKASRLNCHGGSEEAGAPELDNEISEEAEGTVSAERIGDSTNLEFKCRCGSGYSVRIIGSNCFYKLS